MYSGVGKVSWSLPGPTGTPTLQRCTPPPQPAKDKLQPGAGLSTFSNEMVFIFFHFKGDACPVTISFHLLQ